MSGILSSLPGSSRGFGPLPQLFHAEAVFSIPQRAGIKILEAAQVQRVPLVPELQVFLPVLSVSSQINLLVFSRSQMQHPSLCRAYRKHWGSVRAWFGVLPSQVEPVLGGMELHLQADPPQAVTVAL